MAKQYPSLDKKRTLAMLLAAVLCAVLAAAMLALPVFEFNAEIYRKRSGNTFVGDERYIAARAEAEQAVADYRDATGSEIALEETVLERVNNKGETTSMITFTAYERTTVTGFAFIMSGLPGGYVLLAMAACTAGGALLLALGCAGTRCIDRRMLRRSVVLLRQAACWLLLIALMMPVIMVFVNNNTLIRRADLTDSGVMIEGYDATLAQVNEFFFHGAAGDDTAAKLASSTIELSWTPWACMALLMIALLCAVNLAQGGLRKTLVRGLLYAFVIVLIVVILYPYYVMLITAFRSNAETTDMYFLNMLPTEWIWSNLKDIIDRGVLTFMLNSLIMSFGATAIALLCGIPAAYAMARMKFRGKTAFLGFVIMSQMFSPVVLLVGISTLMQTLNLQDSLLGLMLINAAFNQAFAIWLLRGTFVAISPEMEQAACIDGCSTFSALIRILLPMAAPGIVTTLIFVFINAWNEYTIATVLISTPALRPITVGITQFSSFNMIEWQYLFAAALVATVPVVLLFLCIEKHLAAGLTAGGVKG